jgi:RNA polymerase sigma factor (TIGR02999 family)
MCETAGEVTILLKAMAGGDDSARDRLLPLVYRELHRLAGIYMSRERRPDHTLQPTALINEAYVRLVDSNINCQNREHFVGMAAVMMRRVLVDYARRHNAPKRGGDLHRVELEEGIAFCSERSDEVIAVDEGLEKLKDENPRLAQVVELRYFADLTDEQIAALLNISARTVQRDWLAARKWLSQRIR